MTCRLARTGNDLPRGWRRHRNAEDIWRRLNGWVAVVRVSRDGENGPFVAVARHDGARKWFRWEGHRTLQDAMSKADEVIAMTPEAISAPAV